MAEGRLEGGGSPSSRPAQAGVRGRDGYQHLPLPALRLGAEGREGALLGAAQPRTQHHAFGEHDGRGHGAVPRAVEGPSTGIAFEAYVEKVLLPSLGHGQVVVMDNLSAHKGERIRELVEGAGCELLFLPPYSPDLNPIEEAFSKVKGLLRKAGARSRKALVEAMGKALDAVSAQDARGFFEHCGYRALGQPF